MTAVIEVTGLTRKYGKLAAVDDVTFSLEENMIHGLLGRNGAGKLSLTAEEDGAIDVPVEKYFEYVWTFNVQAIA